MNNCRIKYFDAATSIRPHVFRHGDRSSGSRKRGGRKGKMTDLTCEDSEDGDDDEKKSTSGREARPGGGNRVRVGRSDHTEGDGSEEGTAGGAKRDTTR